MSNGPIEFLGDQGPAHTVPGSEFGGADGLIQPERADGGFKGSPESKGGHTLSSDNREAISDNAAIMRRVGMSGDIGLGTGDDKVVDPLTGRALDIERNKKGGTAGELSDLKP